MKPSNEITIAAELSAIRTYLRDRTRLPLPNRVSPENETDPKAAELIRAVNDIIRHLESLQRATLPEGIGLHRSYDVSPLEEAPVVGGSGVDVVDTGDVKIIKLATTVAEEEMLPPAGGNGLPDGTQDYQIMSWDNTNSEWIVDWVRGHS